jgi:hypothetical protein
MRTNARSLPTLYSALFLAASAAAVSCCGNRSLNGTPPPPTAGPNNVTVIVTYDEKTNTQTWWSSQWLFDKKKPIELKESSHDTLSWVAANGEAFEVEAKWTPKRPFDKDPEHDPISKKILRSGPPSTGSHVITPEGRCKDREAQCYEYTAWLWLDADGKKKVKIDPRIVVMP